ncbi:MAG: HlyD family efflux transporter periplasmic adaptor subunit [Planctomycetaceae bacterium]|jgi:multidrug efflux pump subunit AcrA (membrane-fusion protein)|nr:HlyD family efflux transporter periplasmic adaptor subunit [Planctomycetaceae bacterium]
MTQRILVALSLLVMAVSIGGYVWQSNKIAQKDALKTSLANAEPVMDVKTPEPTDPPKPIELAEPAEPASSIPKLVQIDRDPVGKIEPSLIPTQVEAVRVVPIQNPIGLQSSAPTIAQDGVLRYKAILSFVNDIKVVAQTDGIILDILVDEGALVAKDSIMIQIDNRLANAEKEVAIKELESAKLKAEDDSQIKFSEASYEVATSVFNRSQDLYVKGVEPQDDWEKKRLEKIKAAFQIDVSKREQMINQAAVGVNQAKLNASMVQLELRTIKAPFSGVVASMQKERYDWVKAGEEILRLVALDKFRVKGTVRIADSPNTLEGAKAKVIIPVGGGQVEQIDGVVGFVSPESQGTGARNDGTQEYTVWVEIPNKQIGGKYLFRGTMDAVVEITPNK